MNHGVRSLVGWRVNSCWLFLEGFGNRVWCWEGNSRYKLELRSPVIPESSSSESLVCELAVEFVSWDGMEEQQISRGKELIWGFNSKGTSVGLLRGYGQIRVLHERFKGCYPRVLRRVWVDKEFINRWAELIPPLVRGREIPIWGLCLTLRQRDAWNWYSGWGTGLMGWREPRWWMVRRDFKDMIWTMETGSLISLVWTVGGNNSVDQWV